VDPGKKTTQGKYQQRIESSGIVRLLTTAANIELEQEGHTDSQPMKQLAADKIIVDRLSGAGPSQETLMQHRRWEQD
jgi:hypothetical protein